jgi:cytochrome c553
MDVEATQQRAAMCMASHHFSLNVTINAMYPCLPHCYSKYCVSMIKDKKANEEWRWSFISY